MKKLLLTFIVSLVVVSAAASAYAYLVYIPDKIEVKMRQALNDLGIKELQLGKIERKNGETIFHDISLDRLGLSTIGSLSVNSSITQFLLNPDNVGKITIHNLNLTGELSQNFVVTISGWTEGNEFLKTFQNIPTKMLVIKDSNIDLLSDDLGGISLKYNAQIRILDSGDIDIKALARSRQKRLKFQSKINATLSNNGELSLNADTDQISLTYEDLDIKRGSAVINVTHSPNSVSPIISVESNIASIKWKGLPLRDVHAKLKMDRASNIIIAKGSTFGNKNVSWTSNISKIDGAYKSETIITPDKFSDLISFLKINKRLNKKTNFPAFILNSQKPKIFINTTVNKYNKIDGVFRFVNSTPKFTVNGNVYSDKEKNYIKGEFAAGNDNITVSNDNNSMSFNISSSGKFVIRNINKEAKFDWYFVAKADEGKIDFGATKFLDIAEAFSYNSNKPKKTKNFLRFKLPLKSGIEHIGKVNLNISDEKLPLFNTMLVRVYGGSIETQHPISSAGAISKQNKLIISDINLSNLFHDIDFGKIFISGRLGGVIPFKIDDQEININGAILQSQQNGIIKMTENMIKSLFPSNSAKDQQIREALKNYHYDFFEIRLDGDLNDRVMVSINANGYNPDTKDKEPVDISLQIETQISRLFKNLLK